MYISRLTMPLVEPATQRLLANVHALHGVLMTGFPKPAGRVLFRVEPPPRGGPTDHAVVLVQSAHPPDWPMDRFPPGTAMETKTFDLACRPGDLFRFRLKANPTIKKQDGSRKNGYRVGVVGEDDQRAWLDRKAEAGGFRVRDCVVIEEGMLTARKRASGQPLAFLSVRFEGHLQVSDADRLRRALEDGVGPAKGYGFGLLSLARA